MTTVHPIRWLRQHPRAADLLFALMVTAGSIAIHWTGQAHSTEQWDPSWWGTLLTIAAVLPIAMRRTHTIQVALLVVVVQIACELLDVVGSGWVGVLVAIYSLGAHTSGRPRTRATVAIAAMVALLLAAGVASNEIDAAPVISTSVTLTTAFVLGDNLQRRRQHVADLAERAERAERERDLLAREKVTEERTRIARELHDVVAHSVTAMIVQAGAARRVIERDPAAATAALSTIESSGRNAMNELRRVLGVLRSSDATEREPQPSIKEIGALLAAGADLPFDLDLAADLGDLPVAVDLAGFRVVQEALTNVRRHAGVVTRVGVKLTAEQETLVIEVTDDGRGAAAEHNGQGFGLVGMRERVQICGGTLSAGPQVGGGWRVHVELPLVGAT